MLANLGKRKLTDWITAFMRYTENTEPPTTFRLWTAISVVAAALQRKCRINWGTSLVWYPNLYIVLVGPSATGKGTAMSPGLDMLHDLGTIRMASQATSLQALIRRLKETNLSDPDLETGEMQFHSSLTIFSKEFTVFLGYHNRELMSALCDWYDCDRTWAYETIARQKEEIIGVWVNLIGGTTPDLIRSSMPLDAIGGGLTSRIIYIYEEKRSKTVALPMQTPEELELYSLLIHDLEKISLMSGSFKYTNDFLEAWTHMCDKMDKNPPITDSNFEGYLGRRRAHLMKLSMVMSASHGNNPMVLTVDDLEIAQQVLSEAEKKMTNTFKGVGKSPVGDVLHMAIAYFENSPTKEVPYWQFAQFFKNDMDKIGMDRVLKTLEAMHYIKMLSRPGIGDFIVITKDQMTA